MQRIITDYFFRLLLSASNQKFAFLYKNHKKDKLDEIKLVFDIVDKTLTMERTHVDAFVVFFVVDENVVFLDVPLYSLFLNIKRDSIRFLIYVKSMPYIYIFLCLN